MLSYIIASEVPKHSQFLIPVVKKYRFTNSQVSNCLDYLSNTNSLRVDNTTVMGVLRAVSVTFDAHRVELAGRSGRAGRSGQAVTFYTEEDVPLLRSVAHVIFSSGGDVPAWMLSLPKVPKQKFRPRVPDANGEVKKAPQTKDSTKQGTPKKNFKPLQKKQKPVQKKSKNSKKSE